MWKHRGMRRAGRRKDSRKDAGQDEELLEREGSRWLVGRMSAWCSWKEKPAWEKEEPRT